MKCLFCNTTEKACGVHQYGENLYRILNWEGSDIEWDLLEASKEPPILDLMRYDVVLYNWQGLIDSWMSKAPFNLFNTKQVLCYHDLGVNHETYWDAIIFSDPTVASHGRWHHIGRPIPEYTPIINPLNMTRPIVGVHGFVGAQADQVVSRVMGEFEEATVRLHLPFSPFCDPDGNYASAMAERCRKLTELSGVKVLISHEFLSPRDLLDWLCQNDINCYFRDINQGWRGVSSAPDMALAVRKPLAVNRCNAFRHLHGLTPSICVEDSSLMDIIKNGLNPLVPIYQRWSPEVIRNQVEDVLYSVVNKA